MNRKNFKRLVRMAKESDMFPTSEFDRYEGTYKQFLAIKRMLARNEEKYIQEQREIRKRRKK